MSIARRFPVQVSRAVRASVTLESFLKSTDVVDWTHPLVRDRAKVLSRGLTDLGAIAQGCFEWVRDEIKHSRDFGLQAVTCSASEVIQEGSGYCYAKSHLLAALLRANQIPSGFCDQRLSRDDNGAPYSLHGLNAAFLPDVGWYRLDPRGNRIGIDAQFDPPTEQLAFAVRLEGEIDFPGVWPDPLPIVVEALRSYKTADTLWENLPDLPLWTSPA